MSSSDLVAVVALVVSLIALFVTSLQLLLQFFGTAEGYRRCAPSVIGPWARLRHRSTNMSELRYEVQYSTPHFMVLSKADWHGATASYGTVYGLTKPPTADAWNFKQDKILEALHETIKTGDDDGPGHDHRLSNAFDPLQQNTYRDAEKQILKRVFHRKHSKVKSEIRVTWLQLLRELHGTYDALWPDKKKVSTSFPGRTDAAVAIREWNWDFMPSDLLKPLATSTLNDIILLALRLNMQWRRLDLEKGIFLADGNGYSLTSVELRGLGIAFQFNVNGVHRVDRKCVPSKAVDKLMFGIVPGCPDLVRRDYSLVTRERRMESQPPKSLLEDIGIHDRELLGRIFKQAWQEPHNELIMLLCSFLPLNGNPHSFNYSPIWTAYPITSPLHYFEGRVAFMEELKERLDQAPRHKARKTLIKVNDLLEYLARKWKNDFYTNWQDSIIEGSNNDEDKIELIESCHAVFDWTTRYFCGRGFEDSKDRADIGQRNTGEGKRDQEGGVQRLSEGEKEPDWSEIHEGRTRYIDLVAGHAIMVDHSVTSVVKTIKAKREKYLRTEARRKAHQEMFLFRNDPREVGVHIQYHLAREYVHRFKHKEDSVVRHLRDKGVEWDEDYIEAAWWVMILRGISWDMPTTGNPNHFRRPRHWEGEPVPSPFYYTKTPVWIT